MSFRRLVLLVLAPACLGSGCMPRQESSPPTAEVKPDAPLLKKKLGLKSERALTIDQEAIARVLDAEATTLKTGWEKLPLEAQPSQVVQFINELFSTLNDANLKDCPPEFQNDFKRYLECWAEVQAALARLPDAYPNSTFLKRYRQLFSPDQAEAVRLLGGDLKITVDNLNKAQARCYETARNYGLVELE